MVVWRSAVVVSFHVNLKWLLYAVDLGELIVRDATFCARSSDAVAGIRPVPVSVPPISKRPSIAPTRAHLSTTVLIPLHPPPP